MQTPLRSPSMPMSVPSIPASRTPAAQPFPAMRFGTEPVEPSQHVAPRTSLYTMLGYGALALGFLIATLSTMGLALLLIPIGLLVSWFQAKKVRALIKGSGVQVSGVQIPELHALVEQFALRLGMKEMPEVFIVEENMQNGFAVKLGKKNLLLLTDDMVWGSLMSRDPRALGYVVGHELAHIALGHTGTIRSMLRTTFPPLSRADEFSCDNVAAALVDDVELAVDGLTLLTVGPQLLAYINHDALIQQAKEVCADKHSKKAEATLTHPLLLRRIGNLKRFF